jgi:cellulose biosynthesis protein BcsQ
LICQAAGLPCSIIIVGVGNEQFENMQKLDGDEEKLKDSYGKVCTRDIVQFVKYTECAARGNLAEEVLKEIPDQMAEYMEAINFIPKPIMYDPSIY